QHLTQGMSSVPTPGDHLIYLRLDAAVPGLEGATELFDGIDSGLAALACHPGEDALRAELSELEQLAKAAAEGFQLGAPWWIAPILLELAGRLRELERGPQGATARCLARKRA